MSALDEMELAVPRGSTVTGASARQLTETLASLGAEVVWIYADGKRIRPGDPEFDDVTVGAGTILRIRGDPDSIVSAVLMVISVRRAGAGRVN